MQADRAPSLPGPESGSPTRRVAVLGGGVGGLTAALELTRPGLDQSFEVTVYQLGWRLGGKGASGRDLDRGARIEEHGLHLWFGFYEHAFRMMREVYEELGRPPQAPLADVKDAFTACPEMVLFDRVDGSWYSHSVRSPKLGADPWDKAAPEHFTLFGLAARTLPHLTAAIRGLAGPESGSAEPALKLLEEARLDAATRAAQEGVEFDLVRAGADLLARSLRGAADHLALAWRDSLGGPGLSPPLRLIYTTLDAVAAAARGIVEDDVLELGFEAIDDEDWACWLRRHGASAMTVPDDPADRAPVVRSVYDVAFAYPEGDIDRASAAAGTATSDLLKLVGTYQGEMAYKMTAGMGDAIFAPLYEVLRARGVRFRFFHAVTKLRVSPDGSSVEEIDVVPQIDLPGLEYEPLVNVDVRSCGLSEAALATGLGLPCWPNEPLWEQLPMAVKACGTRFETELDPLRRKRLDTVTLRHGLHFDDVVLAIPVGALDGICADLMKVNVRFGDMVLNSATVQTQAFQLWTHMSPDELGYEHDGDEVVSCFVEPLDTYCDMRHLLAVETWPDDAVKGIAYVCGVLKHIEGETQEQANERVRIGAVEYVSGDLGEIWKATPDPASRWDALVDPSGRVGQERFSAQYWRANIAPWERYVITPAGSVKSRLPSGSSGFVNLVLAGDWTRNGINGGCVEAAVVSGMQAAYELAGNESTIHGENPRWLTPK